MKIVLMTIAAVAQAGAAGGQATDNFCPGVRALATAAAEPAPFQNMRAAQPQFRLGRLACFYASIGGYSCSHYLSAPNETRESYATRLMACLPGASRTTEQRDSRDLILVRSGRLEARISERGVDHGHLGRTVAIVFAKAD